MDLSIRNNKVITHAFIPQNPDKDNVYMLTVMTTSLGVKLNSKTLKDDGDYLRMFYSFTDGTELSVDAENEFDNLKLKHGCIQLEYSKHE